MGVAHLFVGMLTAVVVFAVPVVAVFHYSSKFYHEADQKGNVPFLSGLMGALLGLFVSLAIVGVWLSVVSFAGFPARLYACFFSYGNISLCRQYYGENSEMARDFEESLQRGEGNMPTFEDPPPWIR